MRTDGLRFTQATRLRLFLAGFYRPETCLDLNPEAKHNIRNLLPVLRAARKLFVVFVLTETANWHIVKESTEVDGKRRRK